MNTVQIARGQLASKLSESNLKDGELFWLDRNNTRGTKAISDGELYIGQLGTDVPALPIGGTRSFKAMVYQGTVPKNVLTLSDAFFETARVGDFWQFKDDPSGELYSQGFRKNDFILLTKAVLDLKTGLLSNKNNDRAAIRICNSFNTPDADDIKINSTQFDSSNVYDALVELEEKTFKYAGEITDNDTFLQLCQRGEIKDNSLFYQAIDNITVPQVGGELLTKNKRGDLWIYQNSKDGWARIPSGNTDATDIDFSMPTVSGTVLSEEHLRNIAVVNNLQDAIEFLVKNKAELDSTGKVPIEQLPTEVFGSLSLGGEWNPLLSEVGITDPAYQKNWPAITAKGAPVKLGNYFIVNIDNLPASYDPKNVNIQYYDKESYQLLGDLGQKYELNSGDWIIYTENGWMVLDNTSQLSSIKFIVNGIRLGQYLSEQQDNLDMATGAPALGAGHKLVLYKDGNSYKIGGVRLVDQVSTADGLSQYIPRYSRNKMNTLENSTIESYDVSGKQYVTVHSDFNVGNVNAPYVSSFYGDILLKQSSLKFETNGKITNIIPSPDAKKDVQVYLPSKSGVLMTEADIGVMLDGKHMYIPMFQLTPSEINPNKFTLVPSTLHNIENAIYNVLKTSPSIPEPVQDNYGPIPTVNKDAEVSQYKDAETTVIDSDVLLTKAHIQNALSLGGEGTSQTFITPGRIKFPKDKNYIEKTAVTHEAMDNLIYREWEDSNVPVYDVFLEPPTKSGVLLSSNSPIDGGEYVAPTESALTSNIASVMSTDSWDKALWNSSYYEYNNNLTWIYKPDQSVNTSDDVTFNSATVDKISVANIEGLSINLVAGLVTGRASNGQRTIIDADLQGTADSVKKLSNSLTVRIVPFFDKTEEIIFNGEQDTTISVYQPDQLVNKDSDVSFNTVHMHDFFLGYEYADTLNTTQMPTNNTNITDDDLVSWGIANPQYVHYF